MRGRSADLTSADDHPASSPTRRLAVSLGHTLELILLLDGVGVGGALRRVDELIRQALGDGLHVAESSLARAGGDEVDGLVDAAEGGDVDSLAANHTRGTDTGGVLTGARVDDGVDDDLNGVLVGEEVDDVHGVLDDAHSHELLAVVAAVHHERVHEALGDGALRLAETLLRVAARGVGNVHRVLGLHADVVLKRDVVDLRRKGEGGSRQRDETRENRAGMFDEHHEEGDAATRDGRIHSRRFATALFVTPRPTREKPSRVSEAERPE